MCLPHDWLTWRLSGAPGLDALRTDRSEASGTGSWSAATGEYRLDLLRLAFGRDDVLLPQVLGPTGQPGLLRTGAAGGVRRRRRRSSGGMDVAGRAAAAVVDGRAG
ncbi:hypothetical protein [Nonomuraea salmonea]|uniref:hypothetical protein n=1 Tax=Nonomuraea salmonea TaxID=46181 RepID=UPI002FEDABAA